MSSPLKSAIKRALHALGYDLVPYHAHLPRVWSSFPEFAEASRSVTECTLVPPERLFALYQLAGQAAAMDGEIAEVGVYKGGTALLLARVCPEKTIHLFDTFEGMPDTDPVLDRHRAGDFADTSLDRVKRFLADCGNHRFHPGFFPDTAGPVEDNRFCLVYVDVDIYRSVLDCLVFFYPRLVPGGMMVFDDFDAKNCPGVRKAIDEFLRDKPESPIVTARYQCMVVKV